MSCGSANQYESNLVGSTVDAQIASSINGVLAPVSSQYQMQMSQAGGKRHRTRKHMRRRSTKHKKRSHKIKSRKMIRRRK
jgi:hypothetical protein